MILTDEQKEYLRPMMEAYQFYEKTSTISFNEFYRIVNVYKQHGVKLNYCGSCGEDMLQKVKHIYQIWIQ